ncbi:MAG: spinster family MFS transporter [Nevskiales bacterium]
MSIQTSGARPASSGYAWFVVAILMIAYIFSFIDRQILSLLVAPIRRDLAISELQMSLLMGFSFALFYTILGIPLGRLADNKSRRGIIAAGLVTWSVMTALCGTAKQYWQLFMYRIGVGVGEAALSPAAYSMIADYFPPERRATAISVYSMGIYLGAGLAFLLGGLVVKIASAQGSVVLPLIGAIYPWQMVFLIIGGAGLLFAFAFLFVREPPRQVGHSGAPLGTVLRYIWANRRTVLCHNIGFGLIALCSYGSSAWIPTFFVRHYGWDISEVALVYGSLVMVFGAGGIVFGGWLTDRWLKQGKTDAALRVGLWAASVLLTVGGLYVLAPTGALSFALMVPTIVCLGLPFGAAPAAIQEIMPSDMRGQASAVYLFIVNLLGLGIGPTAVAYFTQEVFANDAAVGWSIFVVGSVANLAAIAFLAAGLRPYRETLARLQLKPSVA